MPIDQKAHQFAESIACMIRNVLGNLGAHERLQYLDALGTLTNEWTGDHMQASEELGLLSEVAQDGPSW